MDAALDEANITLSAEEKDIFLKQVQLMGGKELTDEEAEQPAGGAGFRLCPHGHFEATGFAHVAGSTKDCEVGKCTHFKRSQRISGKTGNSVFTCWRVYSYKERCDHVSREIAREYPVEDHKPENWYSKQSIK